MSIWRKIIDTFRAVNLVEYDYEQLDWSDLDQVEAYFEDTIAEGYPSQDELAANERLFNEVRELRALRDNVETILVDQAYQKVNV